MKLDFDPGQYLIGGQCQMGPGTFSTQGTYFNVAGGYPETGPVSQTRPLWASCASFSTDGLTNAPLFTVSQVPPWQRVNLFANMDPPSDDCGALDTIIGAAAVTCAADAQPIVQNVQAFLSAPPPIKSVNDASSLALWLSEMGLGFNAAIDALYLENVPNRVISDLQSGQAGTGAKAGTHGTDILDLEEALQSLPAAFATVGADLSRISDAIQGSMLAVQAAHLQAQSAMTSTAISALQVQSEMYQSQLKTEAATITTTVTEIQTFVDSVAAAFSSQASGTSSVPNFSAPINDFVNMETLALANQDVQQTGGSELALLSNADMLTQSAQDNAVAQALLQLNENTMPLWADIQTQLGNIRGGVVKAQQAEADLQLTQQKAAYQAALGTGADVVMIAGQEIPIPVNTVLNRQASATQIRYQSALTNAKALAYMARRAIEQRIGIPLNSITQPVGALDAPASWADDICSLTGINYQALSTPTGTDAGGQGSAGDPINQFADSFVGDYVNKLSNFVQYFNVQYPSHQGSDTAVLSLRYDLMPPVAQCTSLAPNLLVNSGALDAVSTGGQGWQLAPCGGTKCLNAINGGVLQAPLDTPIAGLDPGEDSGAPFSGTGGSTGITWLLDTTQSGGSADAGADGGTTASDGGVSVPPGMVTQAVQLAAGNYVLSWWDQARTAAGALFQGTSTVNYAVKVYDGSFSQVGLFDDLPYVATAAGATSLWSPRRSITFSVATPGTYYVSFAASTAEQADGGPRLGSVAIADVQLEAALGNGAPSIYVQTSDSRLVTAYGCSPSDSDLRNAFTHVCDSGGSCYFELTSPIVIDTEALNNGTSPLAGKLAKGNYNFRHVDVALNLVGTGVHDCTNTPTQSCFGSGYIEYTLEHNGKNAGILDWNGNLRFFDFGIADIQHGKALAAERYITMPLGSDDQALISQPGIEHIEFAGRPLDGVYQLRVYDSPALQWQQLQDVQVVLNYEYWSQIVANGSGTGN
jgi:hypothetical protein